MLNDFNWFVENRERLYGEYGDSYIAIKNMTVIGVYSSYSDGVNEVSKTEELGTFIVQHCTADESGHTKHLYTYFGNINHKG